MTYLFSFGIPHKLLFFLKKIMGVILFLLIF